MGKRWDWPMPTPPPIRIRLGDTVRRSMAVNSASSLATGSQRGSFGATLFAAVPKRAMSAGPTVRTSTQSPLKEQIDWKSGVWGKRGAVRGDHGGGRFVKKKK